MNVWSALSETLLSWLFGLVPILLFLILFSVVIFFHELGHFLMAKMVGIRVDRFAVGFGYRLFGWRRKEGLTFGRMHQYPEGQGPAGLGETDYCVNCLPLGGYVKMLGQMDMEEDEEGKPKGPPDPRSFDGKSVGQRALVISAGVCANIIFSLLVFMVVYFVGVDVVPPIVGGVMPGTPAERAGLLPGDRILSVNGEKVYDFQDLIFSVALSPGNRASTFVVRRGDQQLELLGQPQKIYKEAEVRQMGVEPPYDVLLVRDESVPPGGATEIFRKGDRITHLHCVEADSGKTVDKPIQYFWDVMQAFLNARGGDVDLTAERKITHPDGTVETKTFTLRRNGTLWLIPYKDYVTAINTEKAHVLGLVPRTKVVIDVPEESAAYKAGFRTGDVIIRVGEIANPTYDQIEDYLVERAGQMVTFTVLRQGKETPEFQILAQANAATRTMTKMGWDLKRSIDDETPAFIAKVYPTYLKPLPAAATQSASEPAATASSPILTSAPARDEKIPTPAAEAGLTAGCVILAVNGQAVANWLDLAKALLAAGSTEGERTVEIAYKTPEGQSKTAQLRLPPMVAKLQGMANASEHRQIGWNNQILFVGLFDALAVKELLRRSNPLEAMGLGVFKTYQNIRRQFEMLGAMANQRISVQQMHGPLGIIDVGRQVVMLGWRETFMFMAILSIGLAVFNFLPIPLLDGGHIAFLIYEKIAGKAAPINFRIWATLITLGIILICGAYVTLNDILRWFK